MVRKQVLRAREHSRKSLVEKVKSESDQKKLTFTITYYPVFQNVRNILQELHILLTPDQEHKNVFQVIPVAGFCNGRSLKDHLVRFNNYKSARRSYRKNRKVSQQRFHEHYGQQSHNGIDDWQFTLIEQCETHEQLKKRETFWQRRLKTFYPYGFNEKKEYLY